MDIEKAKNGSVMLNILTEFIVEIV